MLVATGYVGFANIYVLVIGLRATSLFLKALRFFYQFVLGDISIWFCFGFFGGRGGGVIATRLHGCAGSSYPEQNL